MSPTPPWKWGAFSSSVPAAAAGTISSQYQWNFKHSTWKSPHLQARSHPCFSLHSSFHTVPFAFFPFSFFKRRIPSAGPHCTGSLSFLRCCFFPLLPEEKCGFSSRTPFPKGWKHNSVCRFNYTAISSHRGGRESKRERGIQEEKERRACWKTAHCFKTQLSSLLHRYLDPGIWDSLINME